MSATPPLIVEAAREFLRRHAPFNRMDDAALAFLDSAADARVLREGRDDPVAAGRRRRRTCYIVQRGRVGSRSATRARRSRAARSGRASVSGRRAVRGRRRRRRSSTPSRTPSAICWRATTFSSCGGSRLNSSASARSAITETLKQSLAQHCMRQFSQRAAEQQTLAARSASSCGASRRSPAATAPLRRRARSDGGGQGAHDRRHRCRRRAGRHVHAGRSASPRRPARAPARHSDARGHVLAASSRCRARRPRTRRCT